jgi:hypothetical protein
MGTVRRSVRARSRVSSPAFTRWGGAAACLASLSYGALGYLDAPDSPGFVIGTVVPALELTTPALFLGGFVGLYSRLGRGGGRLTRTGLVVGMLGTALGVVQGLDWWPTLPYLGNWLASLFAGLAVAVRPRSSPRTLQGFWERWCSHRLPSAGSPCLLTPPSPPWWCRHNRSMWCSQPCFA